MDNELVSVIIPVYNSEKYLEKCLDSVVAQSYKNWEIVLVDDGSSDRSGVICDSYSEQYNNIRCIHQSNQGVSAARNAGISASCGLYLCFVDSDDYIGIDYLSHLVTMMAQKNCDMAITAIQPIEELDIDHQYTLDFSKINSALFFCLNQNFMLFGPCCKLYKKTILDENNVRFPIGIQYGEDLIFNFKYMEFVNIALFWNRCDYHYENVSDNSLSVSYRRDMFEHELFLSNVKKRFYCEKHVFNEQYDRFLKEYIFDAGYNAILKTYYKHVENDITSYMKTIVRNQEFHNSISCIDTRKYSSILVFLMRFQLVQMLKVYLFLYEHLRLR